MKRCRTVHGRGASVRLGHGVGWLVCALTSVGCQGTVDGGCPHDGTIDEIVENYTSLTEEAIRGALTELSEADWLKATAA
jgi:hypothetical protein